ncbi:sulfate permease [Herbidospora sp. NBRC 101105]|uniref:SulP family inorganic anion transporter n=1 Tax=Herbidospora sp. NBRC 101105 TaxID=3032195 RepID=UPI0024A06DBC|nr:sulfate permease [Herbidospora sp. NBRC 101105]GLX99602.1 sodium-independent anion transporter [Herbidospora sp. NBRC 101105]
MIHTPTVTFDLRNYRRAWLRGDLLAGLTVAGYLVPQVMAYATVAGLPPVAGLWGALPALALYPLLGSSRQLSIGPESSTALMTAVTIGPLAAGDPVRYAQLAAALAVVVGVLALICWLLRMGFVADLLSRPVLIGYLTGLGLTMIMSQLERITGVRVSGDTFFEELASFAAGMDHVDLWTLLFAGVVLCFLFLLDRLLPAFPGPLLAVLLATVAVAMFGLQRAGIAVIGLIPAGLPAPRLPTPSGWSDLILPAVGVLLVGYSDNMLTGRSFAARCNQRIDANRELLALGVANVGAGLLRGFPISSSGSRTALGVAAGARTQVHSWVTLVAVVVVLVAAGPLLAGFPVAALGAIVIFAATRLIDVGQFRRLLAFRRSEFILAAATCLSVLLLDILYGVLLAVALSVAEMLARIARPHDAVLGIVPGLAGMHDVDDYPQAHTIPGLVIYRYDSPLFFANAEDFRHRALASVDDHDGPVRWFVLNVEANVEVDITALDAVEALRAELAKRGIVFGLARVKQDLREYLDSYGLSRSIGEEFMFPTLPTTVSAYEDWCSRHP